MRCRECEASIRKDDEYCPQCGADLPVKDKARPGKTAEPGRWCRECGADIEDDDADRCPTCGASVYGGFPGDDE